MKTVEHVLYLRGLSLYFDYCHEMMKNDVAHFIPMGFAMLWALSENDENWRSLFHTWAGYQHDLSVSWDNDNGQSMFHA